MGTVTALEKNRRRIEIYLDGRRFASVFDRIFRKRPLEIGQEVNEEAYRQWVSAEEYHAAYEYALSFLTTRARSELEMRRALLRRGCQEETVDRVVKRLSSSNLLNDQAFAEAWVEQRGATAKSRRTLSAELYQKGIRGDAAQEALDTLSPEDERQNAARAAQKIARRYRNEPVQEGKRKTAQALARRGFSWDVVKSVVQAAFEGEEAPFEAEEEYPFGDE